eukprot:3800884-Rhodomonas_salina.1
MKSIALTEQSRHLRCRIPRGEEDEEGDTMPLLARLQRIACAESIAQVKAWRRGGVEALGRGGRISNMKPPFEITYRNGTLPAGKFENGALFSAETPT